MFPPVNATVVCTAKNLVPGGSGGTGSNNSQIIFSLQAQSADLQLTTVVISVPLASDAAVLGAMYTLSLTAVP